MKCPTEIAVIILEIVKIGILTIRATGASDAKQCFVEADHIHNLPALLKNYSPDCFDSIGMWKDLVTWSRVSQRLHLNPCGNGCPFI
jgi:hypothetical protein